ncbi:MAG: Ig-like domain-containing protein [Candidatus Methanoperedens sp.]|nr:Ig-like domain-containing protein [Candidatus Methanoperedens sp.]
MRSGFLQNETAVSPILGAILILAVSTAIITNIQINFVPVWNTQEELNHLEKMNDDFRELKSSIEEGASIGTPFASPLRMGFKYTPKIIAYNPKESAPATLSIQEDMWAEVRYNEVLPEGMNDATTVKNISTATITYSLQGTRNMSYFIYEYGLLRRSGSNYTSSAQTFLVNGSLYLLSVNATEPETTSGVERRVVNIYPTSQAKNSVIGKNVWLIMHTRYVDWWTDPNNPSSLQNQGATIKKKDLANGTIIAYFNSIVIRMGETQVTSASKKPPSRLTPARLVRITPQDVMMPVMGINNFQVEVQDFYNNPVPNVPVNFSVNSTGKPNNAYKNATLLQTSAISGADGRVNIQMRTNGSGIYFIDANFAGYTTTFTYPASSQGAFISLAYTGSEPTYPVTATLTDGFGNPGSGTIYFSTSEGTVTPPQQTADGNGNAATTLNTSTATGLKLTNVQTDNVTNNSARITWDTTNTITVAANRTPGGVVFNSIDIPTSVSSNGCVRYGTAPGNYPNINCSAPGSSHTVTLSGLLPYTVYYFIVNSSRTGGASVNSSEYMFVTEPTVDIIPPASVTNLINVTYEPLYIRWTWTDPADSDFDHVNVYIDGVSNGTVARGVQSFNSSYFRPDSTHTISTHTVDTSGNVNATWVNWTATTPSLFTYLIGFLNTTGTVTNFPAAQNASDRGNSALFNESISGGTAESNNYTNVTDYTAANGTVTNFANMQSAIDGGAYATLNESAVVDIYARYNWSFTPPIVNNGSWTFSYTYTTATGNTIVKGGSNITDGVPPGSLFASLSATTNSDRNVITSWRSPNFTWTNGTPTSATLNFSFRVTQLTLALTTATSAVFLIDPNGVQKQINQSTTYTAQGVWGNFSNSSIVLSDFSASGNYSILLNATLFTTNNGAVVNVSWDNPTITLNRTLYSLNITTNTTSVPVDTNYYLEINYSRDANEAGYDVYVFNGTAWNNRGSLTSLSWAVSNITLNVGEYNSGTPRIRYIDQTPTGSTQGNLYIDYQRIHGYTPAIPAAYRLDVTTNTTSIPDASTQVLQLRYNVSSDNFTLQVWNGSAWDYRTTLNDTVMSYRNITLLSGDLQPDGAFTGGIVDLNKYYVSVRYVGITASPTQQGKLYLDYQRVYSS